jgi:hypothetical protein
MLGRTRDVSKVGAVIAQNVVALPRRNRRVAASFRRAAPRARRKRLKNGGLDGT